MKDLIIAALVAVVLLVGVYAFTLHRSKERLAVDYDDLNEQLYDAHDALSGLNENHRITTAITEARVEAAHEANRADLKASEALQKEAVPEGMDACLAAAAIIEREIHSR